MAFSDRVISACDRAMKNGTLSERHVRDVLRCKGSDVHILARHIKSKNPLVRRATARIIGRLGNKMDVEELIYGAIDEDDPEVLRAILPEMAKCELATSALGIMVSSEDELVRDVVISMLRRAGKADYLLPLLFNHDDALVNRVKRYIHDQKK